MKPYYKRHSNISVIFVLLAVFAASVFISGCSSTGAFIASNRTNVELGGANYKIVATNVTGESEAGYLLGITWNAGVANTTVALARVSGSDALYRDAIQNLWQNYEAKNGSVDGKKVALINIRYDSDNLNLLLYTGTHVSIRADVIEFTD